MGFMDKLKNLFKKKNDEAKAAPVKEEPVIKEEVPEIKEEVAAKRRDAFTGQDKVGDALRFAADKIDAKNLDDKKAGMFMASLKAVEASADPEDVKLIQIGQIIGGIINA